MTGYTKLFSSILDSTIWDEDCATRILWVTMLAMVNKSGIVAANSKSLSVYARLPLTDVNKGLELLTSPDPDSRSKEFEGRRIEKVEGGWKLLNYEKYRLAYDNDKRREYMRNYMQKYRSNVNHGKPNSKPAVNSQLAKLAEASASAYTTSPTPPSKEGFVNFKTPELQNQPQRTKLRQCPVPGCSNPVPAGEIYCCNIHKEWAEKELNRGKA